MCPVPRHVWGDAWLEHDIQISAVPLPLRRRKSLSAPLLRLPEMFAPPPELGFLCLCRQVEGALLELSKKQADLETREKEFDEARKALTTPPHAHNTRVVRQGDDRAGAALVDSLVLTVASPTKPGSDCGDGGGGGGQSEASGVPISSAANTPAASLSTIASGMVHPSIATDPLQIQRPCLYLDSV